MINFNLNKAVNKWKPIMESVNMPNDRYNWVAEMAEYQYVRQNSVNESYGQGTAYSNATIAGMGAVYNPVVSTLPGNTYGADSIPGSGDLGQNLLPVSMKVAAQTIGLDLVAVKPAAGPKIDLVYMDFKYDDVDRNLDERPQVFKLTYANKDAKEAYDAIFGKEGTMATALKEHRMVLTSGGVKGGRLWVKLEDGSIVDTDPVLEGNVSGIVEFLGYSRIDGMPMFRAYRQPNTHGQFNYFHFEEKLNTFKDDSSMIDQIKMFDARLELISALEDHIPGFSANWTANLHSGDYPMGRLADDESYAGIIAPTVETRTIAVGTIKVKTSLRRTEIEDIKASTGIDVVQRMESILVNELSQTISKQIVDKITELAWRNRENTPYATSATDPTDTDYRQFDFDTAYVKEGISESTFAVQRKLLTRMMQASHYINVEGRIGSAQFAIVSGALAATLADVSGYVINPVSGNINPNGQLYPEGQINGIKIYIDPNRRFDDNTIILGRKNNPDQPGLIFIPYLLAQNIQIISEATMAPTLELRSRYAIAEVGYFPEKQYMAMRVIDNAHYLN